MPKNKKNHLVHLHDVQLDTDYTQWLVELKSRYRSAQIKAAVRVNAEKLLFNWQLGRDLVIKKVESRWGAGIVEKLSLDLKAEFPNDKGFSTTNLWDMKKWYIFYTEEVNLPKLHQLGGELRRIDIQYPGKLHQLGGEIIEQEISDFTNIPMPPAFAYIPWRHHVEIMHKSQTLEEALYYVKQTILNSWSRNELIAAFRDDMYAHRKGAITNFETTLPALGGKLTDELIHENFNFSYLTLKEQYSEQDLEDALETNITHFLMQLGTGFAFLGRQQEVVISGKDRRVDLLFYHIRLRCYVVVELKAKPFEPEYSSKLLFYTNAVNRFIKSQEDNPTIGILICTKFDQTEAELSFEGMNAPLALATYGGVKVADYIPSEEILRNRIRQLEEELRLSHKLIHKLTEEKSKK